MSRVIVSPPAPPREPPRKPPSCAQQKTGRPSTVPLPALTPSPTALRSGRKLAGSSSASRRRTSVLTASAAIGEHQRRVLPAEAERVRQHGPEPRRLARTVGDAVDLALGVGLGEVQRR